MDYSVPKKYEGLRAVTYAQQVCRREIVAGRYIIMECERFIKDLNSIEDEDFKWYFDTDVYDVIIGFQNFFKFADGILAGQPMKMAAFQEWILGNLFCWKHKEEDYIRFSKAFIQIARKQGKRFAPLCRNAYRKSSNIGRTLK